jgi:hypothetical protein
MAASDVPDAPQEYGLPPLTEGCEYDDAWLTSTARRINWCANVGALIKRGDGPGSDDDWAGWSPPHYDMDGKVWRYCRRAYTWKLCGRGGLNGKDKARKWMNGSDGKVARASHLRNGVTELAEITNERRNRKGMRNEERVGGETRRRGEGRST